jgi:acetyl-CoA C-acetyltransferase
MRDAVIVSVARTPIGKAYRGAFNNTQGQSLAGHAVKAHSIGPGSSPTPSTMSCSAARCSRDAPVSMWPGRPPCAPACR